MGIPFSSPQAEFDLIRGEWFQAVEQLVRKGVFVGGLPVSRFEEAFASYCGVEAVVSVGNGTDALFLALKSLGVGPGDEVITAANTFIATVEAIHHTGARPVLVDCDPHNYLIDLEQVKRSVTSRTKAIIPVHLYGQMVDLSDLLPWADERGIYVLEDSAQAAGAYLHGQKAGSLGIMGCFSFYPDKNLGALGDGGAITLSSDANLSALRKLRNHGSELRYQHEIPGYNSRLDPIQAIALELKLSKLDAWSEHRRSVAGLYDSYLSEIGSIIMPSHRGDQSHVFHLYVVRVEASVREKVRKHLQKRGILTAIQYPIPVHLTPAFKYLEYESGSFPTSEQFSGQLLSLPMHIAMDDRSVKLVSDALREVLGGVTV